MKFGPVVPEICRGQVHGPRKERRKRITIIIIIITRYDYNLTIMKSPKPATDNRLKNKLKATLNFCDILNIAILWVFPTLVGNTSFGSF
jgi:hypothetical protein